MPIARIKDTMRVVCRTQGIFLMTKTDNTVYIFNALKLTIHDHKQQKHGEICIHTWHLVKNASEISAFLPSLFAALDSPFRFEAPLFLLA